MPKFKVKNPFYWRGKLVEEGATIDVPKGAVDALMQKDVLGEPVEEKPTKPQPQAETNAPDKGSKPGTKAPETATEPNVPENASLPNPKKD